MRKSTLFRLVFALGLAAAVQLTTRPAHALTCADMFHGCSFDGIVVSDPPFEVACCDYLCPNGSHRFGICEQL